MKGVLIGAGYFAQFQAEAWQRLEGPLTFCAVADLAPGKAREFAARHGMPRHYESVEAMLETEQPDFVDIATRPDTHLSLTRFAAERGVDVICQKPMAPTMEDCVAMCEVCEKAGVRLLIHENWRWQPWYREAAKLIAHGTLGALRHLAFDWRTGDGKGPAPYTTQPYFRQMPRLLIYETLVHILDTFRFLAGELRVTACTTRRVNPLIVGEDWAEIEVAFTESSAQGFIHGDRQTGPVPAPVAMGSMTITGHRATLRIDGDGYLYLVDAEPERKLSFSPPTAGYKGDSVLATQRHLFDCLRSGRSSESDGREYLKTVALVEQCYRLAPEPVAGGCEDVIPPKV